MSTENQPTPSLRELCAKATPGPRSVESTPFESIFIRAADGPVVASVAVPNISNGAYWFNAQLIARLSPDVAMGVYETLALLARGFASGHVRAKPILDMSDKNATEWPTIHLSDEVLKCIALLDGTAKKGDAT